MLQAILELFTTEQKAEAMLANPIIEVIFIVLFVGFIVTLFVHLVLFFKINSVRNYVKNTKRIDMEPLQSFKKEFDARQADEAMKVETFVQEKFSSWRLFHIPIISVMKLVGMTISLFILLGVLGTFIGLTISLGSINAGEDQLVENVAGVLSGIDVAFYTSIVGMSFSLLMTIIVRVLNTEYMLTDLMLMFESHLEGEERQGMGQLISVSKNIHEAVEHLQETNEKSLQGIVDSFKSFKDYTSGLQQSAEDLAKFNDGLSGNLKQFHTLFEQMKVVTDGFGEGTASLNQNFAQLFNYFHHVDARNERIVEVFERTYEKVLDVSDAQLTSLQAFDTSVSNIKNFTSSLLKEQADVHRALDTIIDKSGDLVGTMENHQTKFKEVFGDNLHERLANITIYLETLGKSFANVSVALKPLPQALGVINDTQTKHKDLLTDRFHELKRFNETFQTHLQTHQTESENFDKQMREAVTVFGQMAAQNNQLMNEINRMITSVNETFTKRDQQLDTNVTLVKDTLTNYVSNLQGTLGQKLDAVIRNIENSLHVSNDDLKREIGEIRRVSEEINQNHARQTDRLLTQLSQDIQSLTRQLDTLGRQAQSRQIGRDENDI